MTAKNTRRGVQPGHWPCNVQPKQHDTYKRRTKAADARVCPECSVVYHGGTWFWGAPPLAPVASVLCPACERIRDHYPAGTIRLHGSLLEHLEEIRGMVANAEDAEKAEHPLERVMEVRESEEGLLIETTGIHIARRITSKLERRFHQEARIRYPEEQHLIFVELGSDEP
jgi:NMD protein affecting ribosome stability and mRNA decay